MYIVRNNRKTAEHAVRAIPDGKESAMERNKTDSDPAARNQDPSAAAPGNGGTAPGNGAASPGNSRRTGSNKVVILIWVTLLLGGASWFTYSRQRDAAEADRLLNEAYTLHAQGNIAESTDLLRQSAELGNVWAQLYYGERLRNAFGTEQNLTEAVKWLRKAAERKCTEAYYQLGVCYENGEGVERNPADAEAWYKKALDDPAFAESAQGALDRLANRTAAGGAGRD